MANCFAEPAGRGQKWQQRRRGQRAVSLCALALMTNVVRSTAFSFLAASTGKQLLRPAGGLVSSPCVGRVVRPLSLRCAVGDDSAEALFQQAEAAREAAEEAARRAESFRQKDQHADRPKAQNAAEALKNLPAPPPGQPTAPFQAKNVPFSKTKFTRQMVEAQINKPMGLVLEENHPSVKGCMVTKIMPDSNAEAYQKSCDDSEPPLVGAQLVEVNDIEVLGFTLEEVMDTLKDAPAPGWDEEAKGKEVTINTGLPNKAVIDRVRSGL